MTFKTRLGAITSILVILSIATVSAQEDGSESNEEEDRNPCDELAATSQSEEGDSSQFDLTVTRLDECLDYMLSLEVGSGGSATGGNADSAGTAGVTTNSQGSATPAPTSLAAGLQALDQQLADIDVELDPLGEGTQGSLMPGTESDSAEAEDDASEQPSEDGVSSEESPTPDATSSLQGSSSTKDSTHSKTIRQPLDPLDEDVVLKQLREAAEKESDANTKQALWDQYYEYVDNNKGR